VPDFGQGQSIFPVPPKLTERVIGVTMDEGDYRAMPQNESVTGQTFDGARVYIDNDTGRGGMEVDADQQQDAEPSRQLGRRFRTNLVKKHVVNENGNIGLRIWNWVEQPDGNTRAKDDQESLVAFEQGKDHFYTLNLEMNVPTELAKDQGNINAGNQPYLRPRGFGQPTMGKKVGSIKTSQGKVHPVYDTIRVEPKDAPEINQMSGGPVLFNQNVFDIPDSDYAKTNLDVRPTPEQVQEMREGTFKPEKKRTLVEAAQHLQDRFKGSANDPDPLDLTEENLERIAGMMATEGVYNIEQDGNAIGWYDRKLKAAKLVVSLVEPRIMQSPEAEQAFDFALAVTSNGQAVADNFEYALDVFRYFMDNGVMPTSTFIKGGERNASMVAAFNFFNQYNASSQETTIADFLDTDFTVRELINFIDRFNEVNGTNISVPSSEGMNEVVKGSYILGPKIG